MSAAIFTVNVWFHRFTALAWIIGVGFFAFIAGALYRSIGAADYVELIEQFPEGLRALMGLDPNAPIPSGEEFAVNLWLNTQFLSFGAAMFAIYAVVHCGAAIAREREKGTLDLILSQPVARSRFVLWRWLVFVLASAVLAVATAVTLIAGLATAAATVKLPNLSFTLFQAWLVALAVSGYSLAFSCLFLSTAKAAAAAGLLTTALYSVDIVARTVERVDWLGNVSLFHFYDPQRILDTGELSWVGVVVCGGVALGALAAAVAIFERRDIVT